jgi:glycosyltransferase involved in cell wall biosynthesis
LKIPYVTTWHGFYRRRIGRRIVPCVGRLTIAISEPVARHLQEEFKIPTERIRLILHGIDVAHFATRPSTGMLQAYRAGLALRDARPVIGVVGRLASGGVKGFDVMLAAIQQVQRDIPDIEVLVVGDGPQRPFLERETHRLGIHGCVHFVGTTEDVRLPLAVMDVFLFPSRWQEGFGLSLIEAMAAGKPVVAARTGLIPQIIQHEGDGWLVDPDDPSSFAQGIIHLLKDRPLASQLGRHAQARAREAFSLERMVSQVEDVYEEVKNVTSSQ